MLVTLSQDLRIDHRGGGEASTYPNTKIFSVPIPATPDIGVVSIGGAPWDGVTSGFFAGSSSGTGLAINTLSTFTGNFIDLQKAGVSKFSVGNTGNVTVAGNLAVKSAGTYTAPSITIGVTTAGLYYDSTNSRSVLVSPGLSFGFARQSDGLTKVMGTANSPTSGFTFEGNSFIGSGFVYWGSGGTFDTSIRRLGAGSLARTESIPVSANYGAFSIGPGPFDGTTAGFYAGNANGTGMAVNAASGYTGDLANFQVAGGSVVKIASTATIAAPTFTLGGTAYGMLKYGNSLAIVGTSQNRLVIGSDIQINSGTAFGWSSSTAGDSTSDLILVRDAAGILAQRNGANTQAFRVYNTYTDASNYERASILFSGGDLWLTHEKAGTGVAHNIWIVPSNGTIRLQGVVQHNGNLVAAVDNSYDIGASGATRPRNVFLAGYQEIGKITDPGVSPANSGRLYLRDNGSAKMQLVAQFPSGAVQTIATEP